MFPTYQPDLIALRVGTAAPFNTSARFRFSLGNLRATSAWGILLSLFTVTFPGWAATPGAVSEAFVNFETAPVHPIALSPDGSQLAICNLADTRLELFDVTSSNAVAVGSVPVGIDPVSVRFRNPEEVWVVNHISDSVSVVDVATMRVKATIDTLDTPADIVFAGSPVRAFVSCALPNIVQVFDPASRQLLTNLVIDADRPKALAVSPDGRHVYAAIFESGNATTVVGARLRNLLFFSNAVSVTSGPYGGQNPPPNLGTNFSPPLNPALPAAIAPPATGIIVRKHPDGRWRDDNERDWSEFVSGTNALLTQRVPGWDLPDRDLAVIDTGSLEVRYASGLMNLCMAVGVNPASGRIAVVGTDAINEVRFEPNLNGIFARVKLALVDPLTRTGSVTDLNPHLDYSVRTLPPAARDRSIGDPRGIVWTADGTRGYVAGMGSRNLLVVDADGNRVGPQPIELGEGPCGLALDEARQRLYIFNRFSSSISVVDTATDTVIGAIPLHDPTPLPVASGRRHLYDTRRTSGLGQASCASCHVDARMDRLGWDLGNPAGGLEAATVNSQGTLVTNHFHPMKGVMVTQTLQDIIGHEPFHWRGDRPDIESFNQTFTNLQAAATTPATNEMRELRDFLASIRFPPNPNRHFDNSLSTNLALPGHVALGDDALPLGTPLPNGNAVAGLATFGRAGNFCATCHSLPTGLGFDTALQGGLTKLIPPGPNDGRHFPLAPRLEGSLRSKISQFRNMAEKIGMDGLGTNSRAGFGFGHDGSVDSLSRFLQGVRIVPDRDIADLTAFLLSVSGSDTLQPGATADPTPPSSVGRQLTVASGGRPPLFDAMLALAGSPASRVELVAKGFKDGEPRGWFYDRTTTAFQSDRRQETFSADQLLALAAPGNELTFTVVPRGTGVRMGIDRDLDGSLDRDELDAGGNSIDRLLLPRVLVRSTIIAAGTALELEAQIPPLPAPGTLAWRKDGVFISGATNSSFKMAEAPFAAAGDYSVIVSTAFQNFTSAPVRVGIAPLVVDATPSSQLVRGGSNATFTATTVGVGPFAHQWQFNGQNLAGATTAALAVSNAQVANEGAYRVIAINSFGAVTSAPVALGVLINPAVIAPPLSQTAVAGGNATFSVMISGHPPPFGYQLRKSSTVLTNYTSNDRLGFLSLFNLQTTNAGTYRVVVTNAANSAPGLTLDPVTLTVLEDSDRDGLPDSWEIIHGLGASNSADAQFDSDLDGQVNGQEFIAGTDPNDPRSLLKVERIIARDGGPVAVVEFHAASNKTYAVEYQNPAGDSTWRIAAEVVATPTNRLVSITNTTSDAAVQFYRLRTPRSP